MSFLFGKKNKQPANALPAATRDITSSNGQAPPPALAGGAVREVEKNRPGHQTQNSTPSGSVNNSFSSLNAGVIPTPEPKALRERADSNTQVRPSRKLAVAPFALLNPPRLTPFCRTQRAWATAQILHIPGPLDVLLSPPAIHSPATAPQSTQRPRKMAPSTSWAGLLPAQL
jgi:hypothetical protein